MNSIAYSRGRLHLTLKPSQEKGDTLLKGDTMTNRDEKPPLSRELLFPEESHFLSAEGSLPQSGGHLQFLRSLFGTAQDDTAATATHRKLSAVPFGRWHQ